MRKLFQDQWEWDFLNLMKWVKKKICFYNTINGQEKLILNDTLKDCPQNLKKSKTLK